MCCLFFLMFIFFSSLYILDTNPCQAHNWQSFFFHSVDFLFAQMTVSVTILKIFSFTRFYLLWDLFVVLYTGPSVWPAPFVEHTVFSPVCTFFFLFFLFVFLFASLSKWNVQGVWGHFQVFNSSKLINVSVFMPSSADLLL